MIFASAALPTNIEMRTYMGPSFSPHPSLCPLLHQTHTETRTYLERVLDGHALLQALEPLGVDGRRLLQECVLLYVGMRWGRGRDREIVCVGMGMMSVGWGA